MKAGNAGILMRTISFSASILIMGCDRSPSRDTPEAGMTVSSENYISLISAIAMPDTYNMNKIGVVGFLNIEFEGTAVFVSENDYIYGISKNALAVQLPEISEKLRDQFSKKYVFIVGRLTTAYERRGPLYAAALVDITYLGVYRNRDGSLPDNPIAVKFPLVNENDHGDSKH